MPVVTRRFMDDPIADGVSEAALFIRNFGYSQRAMVFHQIFLTSKRLLTPFLLASNYMKTI